MRMEKMFKGAGELTNEVTLPEADVMRFVKMDKTFIGKDVSQISVAQAEAGAMPWFVLISRQMLTVKATATAAKR